MTIAFQCQATARREPFRLTNRRILAHVHHGFLVGIDTHIDHFDNMVHLHTRLLLNSDHQRLIPALF